ncbi:MAG: response regulator [Desulfobacteraceae bacterium]|jgi:two-component system cell cycle sensor histidine kinase/response regulator CckA|nr:response regulator [Desulfobacteraceae bacterium]
MKFLIVDDNSNARMLLKAILTGNGHSVELSENGAQALEKAAASLPDMIISDILMPVMDGFQLCEKIRADKALQNIPFVFYTATYTDSKDEAFALKIGADRFIVKPAEPDEFMEIIHDVVRNVRETSVNNGKPGLNGEMEFFKLYNERLVNKLEKKMLDLEKEVAERKTTEERCRILVDHAGDAIFVAQNGGMQVLNPATVRLTGYSVEELTRMPFVDLIHPEDQKGIQDAYDKSLKGEKVPAKSGFRMIARSGKISWAQMNSTRITWENRPATLNFVRDVTNLRNTEEQLRQAQKMESIGRLAGGVAHDFNNMLSVITGYAEMAMEKLKKTDPLHNDISEIIDAANRSTHLTRQLLAFSRKQIISPKLLYMNTVVLDTLKMLQRMTGENIEIVFNGGDHLWNIYIDPSQVDQILGNLMVNARDAMNAKGVVTIETKNVVLDAAYCADWPDVVPGDYVMLSVSDTGSGMDKKIMANIFEPFFTSKAVDEGTGLGLSTIFGIVKQNNGHIDVSSEPGKGSVFRIYIPRYTGDLLKKTETVPEDLPKRGAETIMVVEDEPQILKLVKAALEKYGYFMLTPRTPEEALQIAQEYRKEIHLLITDVIMPGLNGKEVAEKIKALIPGIKILFMSGYTKDIITCRENLSEELHFIQKPFHLNPFARKVREILDSDKG